MSLWPMRAGNWVPVDHIAMQEEFLDTRKSIARSRRRLESNERLPYTSRWDAMAGSWQGRPLSDLGIQDEQAYDTPRINSILSLPVR